MSHTETINVYYAAWVRDDLEAVMALCTDDVVAVNVPIGPITGKPAVRAFFEKFGRGMTAKRYDIARIMEAGKHAVVEGVEHYEKNGRTVRLPYMSVFRFEGALIQEWRDYFDLQTILRQLDPPQQG